nr:LCP family protein [Streptomyces sp. SID5468]
MDPETGRYELRLDAAGGGGRAGDSIASRPTVHGTGVSAVGSDGDGSGGARSGGRRAARGGRGRAAGSGGGRRKARGRAAGGSRKRKVLGWSAGALGFVLVVGSVGAYLLYQHFNSNISTVDVGDAGSGGPTSDGPLNILVIGTDSRVGLGRKYGDEGSVGHADTTILFHVAKDRSNATALSIPRDLITDVPDCPTRQSDGSVKVIPGQRGVRFNTSLGQDGRDPGCTMRTVKKLTGIDVDHFMMANFNAVKDLSTAVGGVDVCVGKDIDDKGGSGLKLTRGHHVVAGEQALAFVRTRHSVGNGGDLDRIKLQQQFLGSLIRKMKSSGTLTSPTKLYRLADVATKALTVDTGIGTVKKLGNLAQDLSSVNPKDITFATVPVVDNPAETVHATVVLNQTSAGDLFAMVRADNPLGGAKKRQQTAAGHTADPRQGPKADPAQVRVNVLNGSGLLGAAQDTVAWLQNSQGIVRSSNGGNAAAGSPRTTLVYAAGQADQARRLAEVMGLPAAALEQSPAGTASAPMTLTLGKDFTAPGQPLTAPTKAPADVQHVKASDQNLCAK